MKKTETIDNIELFKKHLMEFSNNGLIQLNVVERKKEGFERDKSIKRYFVSNPEEFDKMINLCKTRYCSDRDKPRRIYASISSKPYNDIAINIAYTALKYTKHLCENKPKLSAINDDAFAITKPNKNLYIIDIDNINTPSFNINDFLEFIKPYMSEDTFNNHTIFKTKSGIHIILGGFNIDGFKKGVRNHHSFSELHIDILSKNPFTLLYL
ncbi:MAG: hypothetical protein ACRDD8_14825 [Bacteroidales bacterium]